MSDARLEFIHSKMNSVTKYSSTKSFTPKKVIPPRNAKEHSTFLKEQLTTLEAKFQKQTPEKVEGAHGNLVAVQFSNDSFPQIEQLESPKDGVRVIYTIPETNTVILDTPKNELSRLKKKIDDYGTKTKVHPKSKDQTPKPANNAIIAPIEQIQEVSFTYLFGLNLESSVSLLHKDEKKWFELSCRGGVLNQSEAKRSRQQIIEAFEKLNLTTIIQEFLASEKILFFINCSLNEAEEIFNVTDCVFEVELASDQTYNWLLSERGEILSTPGTPKISPINNSSVITILDSGINSSHPLLKSLVTLEASVHPEDSSAVDVEGHGTEMAGIAAFGEELSTIVSTNQAYQSNRLESLRVFTTKTSTVSSEKGRVFWAKMMNDAIDTVEDKGIKTHRRVFNLAVTAEHKFPGNATSWSLAIDQLSYNFGNGRLFCVSIGNTSITIPFVKSYPLENHLAKIEDPAQAFNVLTIGGFTKKDLVPQDSTYKNFKALAPKDGVSPHTRSGLVKDAKLPIKPEVVFEASNIAIDSTHFPDNTAPSLTSITTGHEIATQPYVKTFATSLATALASKFIADLWNVNENLRPETIRALVVHSATWTATMIEQLGKSDDLLALCGYGVPSMELASHCTKSRATIIIEDELSNEEDLGQGKLERPIKFFTLPLPTKELENAHDKEVELRITLSYFAEPNSVKGIASRGMDLIWDIQGPNEKEDEFKKRINKASRGQKEKGPGTKSFNWDIGFKKRSRGTIQSDRWKGAAVELSGNRLVAVYPTYGWWNQRKTLKAQKTKFSFVISAITPGIEIYDYVKQRVKTTVTPSVVITNKSKI